VKFKEQEESDVLQKRGERGENGYRARGRGKK